MLKEHFKKHGVIHLLWLIVLLILSIVGVISTRDTGNTLYNYVSFAAAISSILLSLIAIFYAMISSQSFSETVGILRTSSDSVNQNSLALKTSADGLSAFFREISGTVSKVPDSVAALSSEIRTRLDELASRDAQLTANPGKSETTSPHPKEGKIEAAQMDLPFGILYAFYCVYLSKLKLVSFNTSDVTKVDYINGIIFGMCSFFASTKYEDLSISRVDGYFQTESLGNLNLKTLKAFFDFQKNESVDNITKAIEMYFDERNKKLRPKTTPADKQNGEVITADG